MPNSRFFHDSFEECRNAFLCAAHEINGIQVQFEEMSINDSGSQLFTDIVHLRSNGRENSLILITSGLHGVEGYVGSALQLYLLDKICKREIDLTGVDLLFIHAINPWGFKNNRRVTRNNVDLNRNFSMTEDLFKIRNDGYTKIRSILEVNKYYSRRSLANWTFLFKILKSIQKYSKATLVQAIGEGQYEYERGIIFGGKSFEQETLNVTQIIQKYCAPYKKIVAIDLHTGLGRRGKLQLLNAPRILTEVKQEVNELFNHQLIDDNDSNFFKEHGSFLDYVWNINIEKDCLPVMFEFGTVNSENTLGALHTLKTMVIENQAYHSGCKTDKDRAYINRIFMEMFYPKDAIWRNEVISQFHETIEIILSKLKVEQRVFGNLGEKWI